LQVEGKFSVIVFNAIKNKFSGQFIADLGPFVLGTVNLTHNIFSSVLISAKSTTRMHEYKQDICVQDNIWTCGGNSSALVISDINAGRISVLRNTIRNYKSVEGAGIFLQNIANTNIVLKEMR
jgi:hypothetical protein